MSTPIAFRRWEKIEGTRRNDWRNSSTAPAFTPKAYAGLGTTRRVEKPLLAGERDGISWLPQVDFRIGHFGRLEFTHEGEDYYMQWMPPALRDMSAPPDYVVAQMDYAGVDRAVIQHDRTWGNLDDYLADAVKRYPDRLVALAQVEEWRGGEPDQIDRVRRQVEELGFSGLYFSTIGFFHADFRTHVNDPGLDPLWDLVGELGVPIILEPWHPAAAFRRCIPRRGPPACAVGGEVSPHSIRAYTRPLQYRLRCA